MPDPANYDDRESFLDVCIPTRIDEGDDRDQAVAACIGMWESRGKSMGKEPIVRRAYSRVDVKSMDDEQRMIEGIATTPSVDRVGDIVEPLGARFTLPLSLLFHHDHREPVGTVLAATATKSGIRIKAQLPKVTEPGLLKDIVDKAWQSLKYNLIRGLSIGFKATDYDMLDGGGLRFTKWDWLELSLVSVPAQAEATITAIKQYDAEARAVSGQDAPSVPPSTVSGAPGRINPKPVRLKMAQKKSIGEQIADWNATRAAKAARMNELMTTESSDKGETLDAEQSEEYEGLRTDVKDIDTHLERLNALEKANRESARPVDGLSADAGSQSRDGRAVRVEVRHQLPKGTAFTRYVMAMAAARGAPLEAVEYAKRWDGQTPEVSAYIKSTSFGTKAEPGTTFGPAGSPPAGWGSALTYPQNLADEFVELLRPATVIGRIDGFRRVPFNVRIPIQTGGSTVNWVGESAPKPTGELALDTMLLTYSKIAGIVVLTDELVRLSSPSAEATVRQDLVQQVAQFMDEQFLDPAVTETTDRPASITNGVTPVSASGTDAEAFYIDLNDALAAFDNTDLGTGNLYVIMPTALARGISTLRNALGQFEFTGMSPGGGTVNGFPVIVSNSVPAGTIVLVKSDEILLADDGNVTIDASNQATLDMAGGNAPTFSLWQKNCIGVRAERWIRYRKRRAEAVAMIGSASYGPTAA